jgi:hypothetical protein
VKKVLKKMDIENAHEPSAVDDQVDHAETEFSPSRHSPNVITRYMSSSSAKRRKIKEADCIFCDKFVEAQNFVKHLKKEKLCRTLYLRSHKLKSLDSLLLRLFSCEFCCVKKRIVFRKHLEENKRCMDGYKSKLKENDLEKLCKKIVALKRAILPSRAAAARALVYKKEETEILMNKSTAMSLNDHRDNVMLSNFKLCVVCKSNFGMLSAREIRPNEDLFENLELGLSSKQCLRRFQKFFLCNGCERKMDEPREIVNFEDQLKLGEISSGDQIKFVPAEVAGDLGPQSVTEARISLMFPTNMDALDTIKQLHKVKGRGDHVGMIYKTENKTRETIFALYENEISKYKKEKESEEIFVASVKDPVTKELGNVDKLSSCRRIPFSEDWFVQQKNDIKFMIDQLGSYSVAFKLCLPQVCPEVIATCLIQDGYTVSVDQQGSANGEVKLLYKVHLDHKSDKDCSEECVNKVDLDDYIANGNFDLSSLGNMYVGTYVSSVNQKLNSIAKNLIQAPASDLYSEHFHLLLIFSASGEASIVGTIWPKVLEEINLKVALNKGVPTMIKELKEFVERSLATTCDARLLRSRFYLSETEAAEVSSLAKEHQFHLCDTKECSACSSVDLPSLETIIKESCSDKNWTAAVKFKVKMENHLNLLSLPEKKCTSTFDWLDKCFETVTGDISDDLDILTVTFHEDLTQLVFEIDERLSSYLEEYSEAPLTGVYHYAISCSSGNDKVSVVYKRIKILECFIQPFSPFFMKACNSSSTFHVVNNSRLFEDLISVDTSVKVPEIKNPKILFTHKMISLEEAVVLMDKTKKRSKSSTVVQWVNAKANRKAVVKKVNDRSEENFSVEGCGLQFRLLENNISRHFGRINEEGLVLAETCSWYDYVGKVKSEELFKVYADSNIPRSEVPCVNSEETLPNFILCRNQDVLQKRSKKKILAYPQPRSEYNKMYSRCLLFLPLASENELLRFDLKDKYLQPNKDGSGTVVDMNEKNLFKMKIQVPMDVSNEGNVLEDDEEGDDEESLPIDSDSDTPLNFLLEALG